MPTRLGYMLQSEARPIIDRRDAPVASKSPLHKLQDTVVGTVKAAIADPVGTAGKAVGQARGTVALGRSVAGQVGKSAVGAVTSRLGHGSGHGSVPAPRREDAGAPLRSVPPARKAPAKKAPPPRKPAAPTPTRPPVTDLATELVKERAAHQPVPDGPPAPESPIDAAAAHVDVDVTPADVAKTVAKKAPARKPAKKAAAKKAAAKKAAATSTPSGKLPPRKPAQPKTAAELIEDPDLPSPIESIGSTDKGSTDKG